VKETTIYLKDSDGKDLGKSMFKRSELASIVPGNTFSVSAKDIEVVGEETAERFKSGQMFLGITPEAPTGEAISIKRDKPKYALLSSPNLLLVVKANNTQSTKLNSAFKSHATGSTTSAPTPKKLTPLYNPDNPNAFVLYRPPSDFERFYKSFPIGNVDTRKLI